MLYPRHQGVKQVWPLFTASMISPHSMHINFAVLATGSLTSPSCHLSPIVGVKHLLERLASANFYLQAGLAYVMLLTLSHSDMEVLREKKS